MTIVKWTPFTELDPIERRMRRWFEEFGFAPAFAPATDIYETDDEFVVELEGARFRGEGSSPSRSPTTRSQLEACARRPRRKRRRSSRSTSGSSASSSAASSSRSRPTPST